MEWTTVFYRDLSDRSLAWVALDSELLDGKSEDMREADEAVAYEGA